MVAPACLSSSLSAITDRFLSCQLGLHAQSGEFTDFPTHLMKYTETFIYRVVFLAFLPWLHYPTLKIGGFEHDVILSWNRFLQDTKWRLFTTFFSIDGYDWEATKTLNRKSGNQSRHQRLELSLSENTGLNSTSLSKARRIAIRFDCHASRMKIPSSVFQNKPFENVGKRRAQELDIVFLHSKRVEHARR